MYVFCTGIVRNIQVNNIINSGIHKSSLYEQNSVETTDIHYFMIDTRMMYIFDRPIAAVRTLSNRISLQS
jgi:hypothetical protein